MATDRELKHIFILEEKDIKIIIVTAFPIFKHKQRHETHTHTF